MIPHKFKLLYFGSDDFSIRILKHLLLKKLCPIQVVTSQGSLLDQFSAKNYVSRHRWPINKDTNFSDGPFNVGLVASFGNLIDERTVNTFEYGLFNVHPSLLPQYRGSTPVQAAIKDGINKTGCTLMRIPPIAKFDVGDVVLQESTAIKYREYALDLRDRLAVMGAIMAEKLLTEYNDCMLNSRPQGSEGRSYAKKITPIEGMIRFRSECSEEIDRKVRAFTGFTDIYTHCLSGSKIRLEGLRDPKEIERYDLNRLATSLLRLKNVINIHSDDISPGAMFLHKGRQLLCIKCADSRWVAFDYMTPEFKAKMSGLDFYNGYLSRVGLQSLITDV